MAAKNTTKTYDWVQYSNDGDLYTVREHVSTDKAKVFSRFEAEALIRKLNKDT